MKKRIVSLPMVLALCLTLLPTSAFLRQRAAVRPLAQAVCVRTTRYMMIPVGTWRRSRKAPAPTNTGQSAIPRSQAASIHIRKIVIQYWMTAFRTMRRHPLMTSQLGIQRPLMMSQLRIQRPLMMNQLRIQRPLMMNQLGIQRPLKLRSLPSAAINAARKAAVLSRNWPAGTNTMTSAGMYRLWKVSPAPISVPCAV